MSATATASRGRKRKLLLEPGDIKLEAPSPPPQPSTTLPVSIPSLPVSLSVSKPSRPVSSSTSILLPVVTPHPVPSVSTSASSSLNPDSPSVSPPSSSSSSSQPPTPLSPHPVSLTSRPPLPLGLITPLPILPPLEIVPDSCRDADNEESPLSSPGAGSTGSLPESLSGSSPIDYPAFPDFTADNGLLGLPAFPWSPASLYSSTTNGNAPPLDPETLNFIHRYYCRECRMEEARRKAAAGSTGAQQGGGGGDGGTGSGDHQPISPQAALDEASLQQAMDLNKESLKRKLMMRRSIPELVDQGIYPSPKTPAAYAEQRMKLERAKIGDSLRHKLEHRPDRTSLVEHHILEVDSTADPSIQEKQRLLKRARLQDSLSGRLAHRPGPLELVERNIISEPELQTAVKDGSLQFPKTHMDGLMDDSSQGPSFMDSSDDNASLFGGSASITGSSNRSEGVPSPSGGTLGGGTESTSSKSSLRSVPTPPDITPLLSKLDGDGKFSFTHGAITSQSFAFSGSSSQPSGTVSKSSSSSSLSSMSGGSRVKKKSKSGGQSKSRVIKFHEYKGPPAAKSSSSTASSPVPGAGIMSPPPPRASTPAAGGVPAGAVPGVGGDGYNAILQQQKLLLQWQLEVQKNINAGVAPPPCMHRQMAAFTTAADLCSPPNLSHHSVTSPSSSITSMTSPGSFASSSGIGGGAATPQPVLTPQPLVCVTPQPSVTPQPPQRILTPLTQSPAPTPSPVPPALIFPVAAQSPIPPAPPPPPLPTGTPKKQVHATITSRVLTIPRSIPVVMATTPNSQPASLAALNAAALPGVTAFGTAASTTTNPGAVTTNLTFPGIVGSTASSMPGGGSITFPATVATSQANAATGIPAVANVPSEQRSQANTADAIVGAPQLGQKPALSLNTTTPAPVTTPIVNHPNNPPKINKLEDLKVADLKAECKKRNLPVSGPKPNLLNKLSAFAEEIVADHQARALATAAAAAAAAQATSQATSQTSSSSTSAAPKTSRSQSTTSVNMKSPPNSAGVKSAFVTPFALAPNDDVSMMPISPPVSPSNGAGAMDLNASIASVMSQPLSPPEDSTMDVQPSTSVSASSSVTSSMATNQNAATSILLNNGQSKAPLSGGVGNTQQPMMIDPQSRPPSVTPMDIDSSASVAMTTSELTSIQENGGGLSLIKSNSTGNQESGLLANTCASSIANISMATVNTTTAITGLKASPTTQIVTTSGLPNGRIGALTLAKPLLANGAKPLQIQLTPLSHPNKPTTAILKQVPVSGQNLTQIQIPVSSQVAAANQPIKVPVQVPTVTQAKVHIPAVPVSGQLAVPVSGALPMSAEVSIPVSGGTITIPVSQLPPHLQAQVQQQIQQQIQQQQAKHAAAAMATANNNNQSNDHLVTGGAAKTTTSTTAAGVLKAANPPTAKVTPIPVTTTSSNKGGGKVTGNKLKAPTKPRGKGKNAKNNAKSMGNSTAGIAAAQKLLNTATLGQPQTTTQLIIKNEPEQVKQEKMSSPVQKVSTTTPTLANPLSSDAIKIETPQQMVTSSTSSPTKDLTTEDLLRQQQRQIEELKSQLHETKSKLDDADKQKQIHQEQLRKLAIAKIATITQQNQLNALLAEQARTQKQIQALAQAHNAQLSQLTKQSLGDISTNGATAAKSSTTSSPRTTSPTSLLNVAGLTSATSTGTSEAKPAVQNLTSLLQPQGLQNINLSQTKIVQVINANGQPQLVLTSQPSSSKSTLSLASVATSLGSPPTLVSKTSHSVPSSPAASSKVPRSSTSPQITRSPPNYDEAIKSKQKSASTGEPNSAMDDVLDILIRSGELPPSAAQEPPPTPSIQGGSSSSSTKTTNKKGGGITSTSIAGSPQSNMITSPTSPLAGTTISIPASAATSPFPAQLLLPSLFSPTSSQGGVATNMTSFNGITNTTSATSLISSSVGGGENPVLVTTMVPSPCSSTGSGQRRDHTPIGAPRLATESSSTNINHPNASVTSPVGGDQHMDFADTLSNALNDLPLLDMEWTSGELGEHFLNSPGGVGGGVGGTTSLMTEVDSKKDINLFTPPLSTDNINQPLLFSPTQLKLGTAVGHQIGGSNTPHDTTIGGGPSSLSDNLTMDDTGVTMEVNDWLEAMMPSGVVGGAPSTPASTTSGGGGGDPILTPKPQDVLDLFNMDEADLYMPTDAGINHFEKALDSSCN